MIGPGDLVLVASPGRLFYARVTGSEHGGRLALVPLERRVRDRSVAVGDIVEHWSRTGAPAAVEPVPGQLRLDGWDR